MILPDEVIVIGNDVEAEALRRALQLWVGTCYRYRHAVIRGVRASAPRYARLKRDMRSSPLVITLSTGNNPAAQMIPLIYRLRTHLRWVGAFVAVVDDEEGADKLRSASLVGDREGGARFADVEGHVVVSRPILLPKLFDSVKTTGEMHHYGWHALLDRAVAARLREAVQEAEAELHGSDGRATIAAVRRMMALVRQLDWQSVLDEPHKHWGVNFVSALLREHPQNRLPALRDCGAIIEEVTRLISRSCLGGADERI